MAGASEHVAISDSKASVVLKDAVLARVLGRPHLEGAYIRLASWPNCIVIPLGANALILEPTSHIPPSQVWSGLEPRRLEEHPSFYAVPHAVRRVLSACRMYNSSLNIYHQNVSCNRNAQDISRMSMCLRS